MTAVEYQHLLVDRDGDTVRITMNRPERRNALSADHLAELVAAFRAAGAGDATGIVLGARGPVSRPVTTSPMSRRGICSACASC